MRRRIAGVSLFVLIASVAITRAHRPARAYGAAEPSAPATVQHLIVVSVDGMKPESYTEPDAHGLKVPTLREIARNGASSDGVQPVMPTVTYPSHTTMVTGVNPGTHGIVTNPAWDPLQQNYNGYRWYEEDIRVATLWQLARRSGLRTALIHWPVTVGVQADINIPEYWRASIPEDLKIQRAVSTRGILEEIGKAHPDFIAGITEPTQSDVAFTDAACYAIEKLKPNLLLLHLAMVDHEEHQHGSFSPEANAATETADAQIARIIAESKKDGMWDSTVLAVLSDHGFMPISNAMRPGVLLRSKGLIALNEKNRITTWKASVIANGGSAYIYIHDPSDNETRQAVLDIFRPLAGAPESGIRRIADHNEIVAMGGDPEAFIALEAADSTVITGEYTGETNGPTNLGGTHGYFPDRPQMRSSLLFYGTSIAAGKIENARMIDIAPTFARWLGLDLPNAQGTPVRIPTSSKSTN